MPDQGSSFNKHLAISALCIQPYFVHPLIRSKLQSIDCWKLTEILLSLSLTRTLFLFQEMLGSGWPRGGIHSSTAGSPAATTASLGAWRKSSLSAMKGKKGRKKARGTKRKTEWLSITLALMSIKKIDLLCKNKKKTDQKKNENINLFHGLIPRIKWYLFWLTVSFFWWTARVLGLQSLAIMWAFFYNCANAFWTNHFPDNAGDATDFYLITWHDWVPQKK